MPEWVTEAGKWIAVFVGGALIPLLALIFTKGKDFWLALKGESRASRAEERTALSEQRKAEAELRAQEVASASKGYEFVISELKEQNDKLEKERKEQIAALLVELQTVRNLHFECEKKYEGLRVLSTEQTKDIHDLQGNLAKHVAEVERLRNLIEGNGK